MASNTQMIETFPSTFLERPYYLSVDEVGAIVLAKEKACSSLIGLTVQGLSLSLSLVLATIFALNKVKSCMSNVYES